MRSSGERPPKLNILHACRSILLAILFKNVLEMLKKSVSLLHFHTPVEIISLIPPPLPDQGQWRNGIE